MRSARRVRPVRPASVAGALLGALVLSACSGTTAAPAPSTTPAASSSAPVTTSTSAAPSSSAAAEPTVTRTTKPAAPRTTAPRPVATDVLTGLRVSANPLIAVKIDNTKAGLPHYGVSKADIVYVEQVEGGLTRLIALFRSTLPEEVGPVRSVRSTDSELLSMYGSPGLAFSGGAGGPLERLAKTSVVNLSPDTTDAYWRSDKASGTYNLHVNVAKLAADSKRVGQPRSPGFRFSAAEPRLAALPVVRSISVTMLAGLNGFHWGSDFRYTVTYKGEPYVDADGSPVKADNVLVQRVTDEPDGTVDSVGSPSYLSHTVGSGEFTLYRDGRAISGTWKRPTAGSATSYTASDGKPALFKPGRTWVVLAPQNAVVSQG